MNEYQKGVFLEEQILDCKSANNIGGVVRFEERINYSEISNALKKVIMKHPNLHSSIHESELVVNDEYEFILAEREFVSIDSFREYVHEVFEEKNVISTNQLFFPVLCHVGDNSYLIIRCHHLIADGFSMAVIANDVNNLWNSNFDYVVSPEVNLDYGNESLCKIDEEILNKCSSINRYGTVYEAQRTKIKFPDDVSHSLKKYGLEHRQGVFAVLLHAFSTALLHFQEADVLQIGIPVSVVRTKKNRPVGMYANIVPFFAERNVIESKEGLEQTKRNWYYAVKNYRFPYYKIGKVVGDKFEKYDYTFNYLPNVYPNTIGGKVVDFLNVHPKYQMYRLQALIETERNSDLYMVLDWDEASFSEGFDKYFIDLYFKVLKNLLECGKYSEEVLSLDVDTEIKEKCATLKNSIGSENITNPFALFRNNCINHPDGVAIVDSEKEYTYKIFENDVLRMAMTLRKLGIQHNSKVLLDAQHTYYELVVIYALLYLGSTMIPVNGSEWETERINSVVEQINPSLIISDSLRGVVNKKIYSLLEIADLAIAEELVESQDYCRDKFDAYIIFTSGTTGKPKGVTVAEKALYSYLLYAKNAYEMSENDCMPLFSTLTFDFTLTSVYLPLISGARIKLFGENNIKHPLYNVFEDSNITVVKVTPSHMKMISLLNNVYDINLRLLIVGGENLSYENLYRFSRCIKHDFVCCNEYGPTEATIGCVTYFLEDFNKKGNVPIGLPSSNARVRIVDEDGNDVPCFVKGQLLISGDCLSEGYWKDEKKTNEKFIYSNGARWYKTGDIAWFNSNGYIEYGGRIDSQKKYHGYRIELEEISNAIINLSCVKDAVALLIEKEEDSNIVLFYISDEGNSDEIIKAQLYEKLPSYIMVNFCRVDKIPLTINGKINEKELARRYEEKLSVKPLQVNQDMIGAELKEIISKVLGVENTFDASKTFYELGGDSIKSFACLAILKEKGYEIKQNYFRMPISIAEINNLIEKTEDKYSSTEYDVSFEPTALIKRFIKRTDSIGSIAQCIVLDIHREFDANNFIEAMYEAIDGFKITVNEDGKLLYRSKVLPTKMVETTFKEFAGQYEFDINEEGLFKFFYFKDIDKYGMYIHHLAIDFVSWQIILDATDAYLSGEKICIGKVNSFPEYCDKHKNDTTFDVLTNNKVERVDFSIYDAELIETITASDNLYGVGGETVIKTVICNLIASYYNKDNVFLECEGIGRENGESDIGWFTKVCYESYNDETQKIETCKLNDVDRLVRFNYIPLYKIKEYEAFTISDKESSFAWRCNVDYDVEFDIVVMKNEIRLCASTSDYMLVNYIKSKLIKRIDDYYKGKERIDIDFNRDDDVELEDLLKLLA